jgi:sec-independent protein translocase protein TatC
MTAPELDTLPQQDFAIDANPALAEDVSMATAETEVIADDDLPDDVEMSLFDHLEELRQRIFYALIAVAVGVVGCFFFVKQIVQLLEVPAGAVKFLQLAPGEYFFVSMKVAA